MLLGAEEFGFSTAPLVVAGCVMMRVCHLDTCPVGIATQNPVLRERYTGTPEFVETFFTLPRRAGPRVPGGAWASGPSPRRSGAPRCSTSRRAVEHHRARGLDLAPLLRDRRHRSATTRAPARRGTTCRTTLDATLIELAAPALQDARSVRIDLPIRNVDRTAGTMLGSEVTRIFGPDGLPDNTIDVHLTGTAGQSLGAFLPRGIGITLLGDANDYVGKGLSGGRIVVRPDENSPSQAPGVKTQVIAGNTIGYGATSGEIYLRGRVGERFAVRNSGALMVTEGTGDHACEYMTGGRVVILGRTGRNVGAGMSGGIAYLLDPGAGEGQPRAGRPRGARRRRGALARRGDQLARQAHRVRGSPPPCSPTGRWPPSGSPG